MSRESVRKWRARFAESGLKGLTDAKRPGAPRKITDEQVEVAVTRVLTEKGPRPGHALVDPVDGGPDRPVAVVGVADLAGLRPQAPSRRDVEAVRRPAVHRQGPRRRGPLHEPARARLVLAVDEKSQIQALDRTIPCLPMLPTTPAIHQWLLKHPRLHLHFTPTSSSWLNLVERWFAELTNRKPRRSAHRSVTELETDIRKWINEWNNNPKPFVWTKSADDILETLAA